MSSVKSTRRTGILQRTYHTDTELFASRRQQAVNIVMTRAEAQCCCYGRYHGIVERHLPAGPRLCNQCLTSRAGSFVAVRAILVVHWTFDCFVGTCACSCQPDGRRLVVSTLLPFLVPLHFRRHRIRDGAREPQAAAGEMRGRLFDSTKAGSCGTGPDLQRVGFRHLTNDTELSLILLFWNIRGKDVRIPNHSQTPSTVD